MNYRTGGLPIKQYQLVKQYLTIDKLTFIKHYRSNVHELIYSEEFAKSLFKGGVLKYKDLRQQFLEMTPEPKKPKIWDGLMQDPSKVLGKHSLNNFYSTLGHGATIALTHLAKALIDAGIQVEVANGLDFNRNITDFDNGYDVTQLTKKKVLIFYYWNSVHKTDFKQRALDDLLLSAYDRNIPVFISSSMKLDRFYNLEFDDGVTSPAAVLEKIYGGK